MAQRYTLGCVGGGNMAEAILRAALEKGVLEAREVAVADPEPDRRAHFEALHVKAFAANAQVIANSNHILLAVKPQMLDTVAQELRGMDPARQGILSILAGVSARRIEQAVGKPVRVVRIMPNTPLVVGRGMSALAPGPHATPQDMDLAMRIFSAAGLAVEVQEKEMDAVTALSGSGPAYCFYLAEAMEEAGRQLGLGSDLVEQLTRQTILGAGTLLTQAGQSPQELRRRVTSPGGTTEAALAHMEKHAVQQRLVEAILAAARRSSALGSV